MEENTIQNDDEEEDQDVNKYLQHLDQQVRFPCMHPYFFEESWLTLGQSQALKYSAFEDDDDDESLDEENLLDSPMDKVEPYGVFKTLWLGMSCRITLPNFSNLSY